MRSQIPKRKRRTTGVSENGRFCWFLESAQEKAQGYEGFPCQRVGSESTHCCNGLP